MITVPGTISFTEREWSVLLPLVLEGFFETYDTGLLTLAAPVLASGLGVAFIRLAPLGPHGLQTGPDLSIWDIDDVAFC
jgi:hypothetical protein